jgi:transcriptional regulator with XRE-family HTH domain
MTITGRQIREARTLLGWDRSTVARRTGLPIIVVTRAEASDGEPHITMAQGIAIKHALAIAGIEFTTEPPGVRLPSTDPT